MKDFYKKLHNGEIKIDDKTQLTDNEWLGFAVYYNFTHYFDRQNMAYHLVQTIDSEEGGCARIICFYANWFYNKAHKQNDDTNKKKKFTLKSSKTRELIKQYARDYLDFDIELDYEDVNEKTE
jgi:hypothetical protein